MGRWPMNSLYLSLLSLDANKTRSATTYKKMVRKQICPFHDCQTQSPPNALNPTLTFLLCAVVQILKLAGQSYPRGLVRRIPVSETIWVHFKQKNIIKHSSNNHDSWHSFPFLLRLLPLSFLFKCLWVYPTIIHPTF